MQLEAPVCASVSSVVQQACQGPENLLPLTSLLGSHKDSGNRNLQGLCEGCSNSQSPPTLQTTLTQRPQLDPRDERTLALHRHSASLAPRELVGRSLGPAEESREEEVGTRSQVDTSMGLTNFTRLVTNQCLVS